MFYLTNCIFVMISENFNKTLHTRPVENSMYVKKSFSKNYGNKKHAIFPFVKIAICLSYEKDVFEGSKCPAIGCVSDSKITN